MNKRSLSRRQFFQTGAASSAVLAMGAERALAWEVAAEANTAPADLHQHLLAVAGRCEQRRRARFAAVASQAELAALQKSLRRNLLRSLGELPDGPRDVPRANITGVIDGEDYRIAKLTLETWPGYFATALLYRPKRIADGRAPGVISPCGHSENGKAASTYQALHANLARRGYFVLTYDPVGQAERSQFWDAKRGRSKFNLICGEHAVLGNALYAVGFNLARYRVWDGMRALDYLQSLKDVDPQRLACVGNSGGGTLTAYLAALDERIRVAAICCYITTIPRRMASRIAGDPDSDPEQDLFGMMGGDGDSSDAIDHAGLLALRAPRPTMLGVAQQDFFPVAGARESFAEAQHLFEVAGARERIEKVEAPEKHGLSLPLRRGVYRFFDRWLLDGRGDHEIEEKPLTPRSTKELQVTADGQVNGALGSRHLLSLAWEHHKARKPARPIADFRDAIRLAPHDPEPVPGGPAIDMISKGSKAGATLLLCVNGNESPTWQEQAEFTASLRRSGHAVAIVDTCGVGSRRVNLSVNGHDYADPMAGVEADLAYNAFLVGTSLVSLRTFDLLAAVAKLNDELHPRRLVVCGRRDAALVALFTAAIDGRVTHLAVEDMLPSYHSLFDPAGRTINAASITPDILRMYGDIPEIIHRLGERPVLLAHCQEGPAKTLPPEKSIQRIASPFSGDAKALLDRIDR